MCFLFVLAYTYGILIITVFVMAANVCVCVHIKVCISEMKISFVLLCVTLVATVTPVSAAPGVRLILLDFFFHIE